MPPPTLGLPGWGWPVAGGGEREETGGMSLAAYMAPLTQGQAIGGLHMGPLWRGGDQEASYTQLAPPRTSFGFAAPSLLSL